MMRQFRDRHGLQTLTQTVPYQPSSEAKKKTAPEDELWILPLAAAVSVDTPPLAPMESPDDLVLDYSPSPMKANSYFDLCRLLTIAKTNKSKIETLDLSNDQLLPTNELQSLCKEFSFCDVTKATLDLKVSNDTILPVVELFSHMPKLTSLKLTLNTDEIIRDDIEQEFTKRLQLISSLTELTLLYNPEHLKVHTATRTVPDARVRGYLDHDAKKASQGYVLFAERKTIVVPPLCTLPPLCRLHL